MRCTQSLRASGVPWGKPCSRFRVEDRPLSLRPQSSERHVNSVYAHVSPYCEDLGHVSAHIIACPDCGNSRPASLVRCHSKGVATILRLAEDQQRILIGINALSRCHSRAVNKDAKIEEVTV